ncbi:MAG: hypothetical protein MZV64_18025 [Ignavibacteriales bacterium]|nr:hypothetical protein [Ignavibacteriales bacterium]
MGGTLIQASGGTIPASATPPTLRHVHHFHSRAGCIDQRWRNGYEHHSPEHPHR